MSFIPTAVRIIYFGNRLLHGVLCFNVVIFKTQNKIERLQAPD